jgi:hypothetical protein
VEGAYIYNSLILYIIVMPRSAKKPEKKHSKSKEPKAKREKDPNV